MASRRQTDDRRHLGDRRHRRDAPRLGLAGGTYWFCPAECTPALRTERGITFQWVLDQTVWKITGYRDGYFWGVASALLTPAGETPDPSNKATMTLFASITPAGEVHITFVRSGLATTIGTGRMATHRGQPAFEMQMSSGPGASLTVHWTYMLQVQPGDPPWLHLPAAGVSVEDMVGDIEPPSVTGTEVP